MLREHPIVEKFLRPATNWYVAVILGAILLLAFSACNFVIPKEYTVEHKFPPPVEPVDPNKPVVALTFKGINNGVIQQYCLSCHIGQGRDLSSYSAVMNYVRAGKPDESPLCQRVKDKSMPLGKTMDQKLIDDVCKWIAQGAKES